MFGATPEVHRPTFDDPAPVAALRKIAKRVELQIGKYTKTVPRPHPSRAPAFNDFARLARRLCGKSIGLVLGGGGARGIAHIGVLRALQDEGIPVDMVGGTSIGAFVGGLYAREGELVSTYGRAKRFSGRMSTLWRILTDLTYPVVAYTTGQSSLREVRACPTDTPLTGHEFNRGIFKSFYDVHIEVSQRILALICARLTASVSRRTCGYLTSATRPTSLTREWTFTRLATLGATSARQCRSRACCRLCATRAICSSTVVTLTTCQ